MTHTSALQFYSKQDYFTALTQRFDQAGLGSRILLMSMNFEPQTPEIAALLDSLAAAAERGADVTLSIDARSFLAYNGRPGPLWFHLQLPARLKEPYLSMLHVLDRINAQPNARAVIINQPGRRFSLTVGGRSHIKTAIIDDYVFIGGCNLDDPAQIDLMIGWQDMALAGDLYSLMRNCIDAGNIRVGLTENGHAKDRLLQVNANSQLLIDAGATNQSLILSQALRLIDSARDWLMITCQYFPNSITAQHLMTARRRGVNVEIIYTHPMRHGLVAGSEQSLNIAIERCRLPAAMFSDGMRYRQGFLHAKIIACDQGLLIGSHNYVRAGVRLGTAEIALQVSDEQLAKQAAEKINAVLGA